ncbi:MAG: Flp pilus assembly complex ATPase component TadA [Ignavibacteriales bacterium]|nr:Flp pilus assembly complex ATPase component TadA [Ignavibacteriales bacterium]
MQVLRDATEGFVTQVVERESGEEEDVISIEKLADQDGSIIKLVNTIIFTAVQKRASDVHIESKDDDVKIKFRIDGVLGEAMEAIDKKFQSPIISRIKVMSDLDIAERRVPQDGRFRLKIKDKTIDFRVSIMPCIYGEDAVIRILDKEMITQAIRELRLDVLGFSDEILQKFRKYIAQPYGMVLVTGPTGSGKTTTPLRRPDRDPVARGQDRHHRGPGRVPGRRHHPDPGQREEGPDLRPGPAVHPPPRPGQDHGRRDPRPGDGPDRHPVRPDRPPRLHDRPRQQRLRRHRALPPHAGRPLQLHLGPQLHPGPAPGPGPLPDLQGPRPLRRRGSSPSRASTRPGTPRPSSTSPRAAPSATSPATRAGRPSPRSSSSRIPSASSSWRSGPCPRSRSGPRPRAWRSCAQVGMEKVLAGVTGLKDLNKVTFVE